MEKSEAGEEMKEDRDGTTSSRTLENVTPSLSDYCFRRILTHTQHTCSTHSARGPRESVV